MTRQVFILLVFLTVFGTVATGTVHGEDTVYVQNIVKSSSHSGGYTTRGSDGADGQDGQDGAPGQNGKDAISGDNSWAVSRVNTTTTEDGSVSYVYASTSGDAVANGNVVADADSATVTESQTSASSAQTTTTNEQRSQLKMIIAALQKLIEHYVNVLF